MPSLYKFLCIFFWIFDVLHGLIIHMTVHANNSWFIMNILMFSPLLSQHISSIMIDTYNVVYECVQGGLISCVLCMECGYSWDQNSRLMIASFQTWTCLNVLVHCLWTKPPIGRLHALKFKFPDLKCRQTWNHFQGLPADLHYTLAYDQLDFDGSFSNLDSFSNPVKVWSLKYTPFWVRKF